MCWEQSRLKRTIATSRRDDSRDESQKSDNLYYPGFTATKTTKTGDYYAKRYRYAGTQRETVSA
jgi:hypothetical protein